MKKVAVITAAYNAEKYLADCALSVAKSITNDEFVIEHVIINDASTDKTAEIIAAIPYPNVKKLTLAQNKGPAGARNEAVKNTEADYLFCLDSDDVIFQNSLRYLFEYLEQTGKSWVYGDFLRADEKLSYLFGEDYYGWRYPNTVELLESIFLGKHFFEQNSFYGRGLFTDVGGFDEKMRMTEDLDLFLRFLLKTGLPDYMPTPLYIHRFHEDNLTKDYRSGLKKHKTNLKVLYNKYCQQIETLLDEGQKKTIEEYLNTG